MYTWTLPSSLATPVAMGAPTNRSDRPSAFRSTAHTLAPKYDPSYVQRYECSLSIPSALKRGQRCRVRASYLCSRHFGDDPQHVFVNREDEHLRVGGETHSEASRRAPSTVGKGADGGDGREVYPTFPFWWYCGAPPTTSTEARPRKLPAPTE